MYIIHLVVFVWLEVTLREERRRRSCVFLYNCHHDVLLKGGVVKEEMEEGEGDGGGHFAIARKRVLCITNEWQISKTNNV